MLPVVEIPPLVAESAKCFDGVFSLHQSKHFERYLTGLMTDSNITVAHMAENLVEGISQRGLNRFLTEYEGDAEELNPRRIKLLQEDPKMR